MLDFALRECRTQYLDVGSCRELPEVKLVLIFSKEMGPKQAGTLSERVLHKDPELVVRRLSRHMFEIVRGVQKLPCNDFPVADVLEQFVHAIQVLPSVTLVRELIQRKPVRVRFGTPIFVS